MASGTSKNNTAVIALCLCVLAWMILLAGSITRTVLVCEYLTRHPSRLPVVCLVYSSPYIMLALAVALSRRWVPGVILLLLPCAALVFVGIKIDVMHFPHISKDSGFDGVIYLGQIAVAGVCLIFAALFRLIAKLTREEPVAQDSAENI